MEGGPDMPPPIAAGVFYWMASVTPDCVLAVPTVMTIGTALPEGAPTGISTFTCSSVSESTLLL